MRIETVTAKLSSLTLAIQTVLLGNAILLSAGAYANDQVIAKNVEFNADFINGGVESFDLSRFANGASAAPGRYQVSVVLNNEVLDVREIEFKEHNGTVEPCLPADLITSIGFNKSQLSGEASAALMHPQACTNLAEVLPDASFNFDSSEQRLDISIPQRFLAQRARGDVNPAQWDRGINGGFLGYSVNGWQNKNRTDTNNLLFTNLNTGINIDGWFFRHNGNWTYGDNVDSKYTTMNSYVQRDITPLRSRLLAGQSNTSGVLFDTLPYTGVTLSTDERMLPSSQRGYAPDIRGIARTNARVTVRQSGQVIYETTVSPGEFLINDLYPTGYGGDLQVTVTEADGSTQNFAVPYASVAQLLRPGTTRYAVTAGQLRSEFLKDNPALYQGTVQHGINNSLTTYSGLQLSQDYYALQLGGAVSTPIGAVAADVTQARAHLNNKGDSMSGQSYRVSWNKTITETGSNLSLATYRFSTGGYMDFLTAATSRQYLEQGLDSSAISRIKNRATLAASQTLPGNWGQFWVNGSVQNYWNSDGSDVQYQLGYNSQYKSVTWGVSAGRSRSNLNTQQTTYLLSLSFPLGSNDNLHRPYVRMDWNKDSNGGNSQQATVSGDLGSDNQFGYSATASHDVRNGDSGSLSGQYRSPVSSVSGSISQGEGYRSTSLGLTGTVLAHSGGITLTPYNGETFAIVEAKGAKGASVTGYPGITIDRAGYAAVPYMHAYQYNEITIDPKNAPEDIELANTQQRVVPWDGAMVKVSFNSQRSLPVLINGRFNGEPLPFAAEVVDASGATVGSVGQAGQVYARVQQTSGELTVRWGNAANQQCALNYAIPDGEKKTSTTLSEMTLDCQKSAPKTQKGTLYASNQSAPRVAG
ncbi:pilus assembly protein PapC [Enterobacterales bacterium CwR94]|nr:pilus assembly protein PapC [Enterobacterales bacterium CwR94]